MKYDEAKELYENYTKDFDMNNDKVNYKYNHSYRVANNSLEIAKSLNLSDEQIELAHSCGLLHDIGRFVQVTKFDTYQDLVSLDHGDQGYLVLKNLGVTDEIVLNSTKYHNKRIVPDELTEEEKLYTNITRDADKIDILFNTCIDIPKDKLNLTDEMFEVFKNKKLTVDKTEDHSDAIHYIRCASFIFDINFKYTYKIIKENNLILSKIDSLIKVCDDERLLEIKKICEEYIVERISE